MIADNVIIDPTTSIPHKSLVNLYGCTIGAHTKISTFVEIQDGVHIGKNCKIGAFSFIPSGVTIEDNVFIGPRVTFTNDKHPKAVTEAGHLKTITDWVMLKTHVGSNANIGAGAVILPGIIIGAESTIGAGAVVTRDVPHGATVIGNPAHILRNKEHATSDPTTPRLRGAGQVTK